MNDCAGCRERDLRIEQPCIEARRIEEKLGYTEAALHDLRRRQENPKS